MPPTCANNMRCNLICIAVSDSCYAGGPARAVCKCDTHNFMLDYGGPYNANTLCPIGQIEEARDEALALIEEANK